MGRSTHIRQKPTEIATAARALSGVVGAYLRAGVKRRVLMVVGVAMEMNVWQ
jgi:hypothetical protein